MRGKKLKNILHTSLEGEGLGERYEPGLIDNNPKQEQKISFATKWLDYRILY
jgi:hypothetical protein